MKELGKIAGAYKDALRELHDLGNAEDPNLDAVEKHKIMLEILDTKNIENELLDVVHPEVDEDIERQRRATLSLKDSDAYEMGIITDEDIEQKLASLPEPETYSEEDTEFAHVFFAVKALSSFTTNFAAVVDDKSEATSSPNEPESLDNPETKSELEAKIIHYKEDNMLVVNGEHPIPLPRDLNVAKYSADTELVFEEFRLQALKHLIDNPEEAFETRQLWEKINFTDSEFNSTHWANYVSEFLDEIEVNGQKLVNVWKASPAARRRNYQIASDAISLESVEGSSGYQHLGSFKLPTGRVLAGVESGVMGLLLNVDKDHPLVMQHLLDHEIVDQEHLETLKNKHVLKDYIKMLRSTLAEEGLSDQYPITLVKHENENGLEENGYYLGEQTSPEVSTDSVITEVVDEPVSTTDQEPQPDDVADVVTVDMVTEPAHEPESQGENLSASEEDATKEVVPMSKINAATTLALYISANQRMLKKLGFDSMPESVTRDLLELSEHDIDHLNFETLKEEANLFYCELSLTFDDNIDELIDSISLDDPRWPLFNYLLKHTFDLSPVEDNQSRLSDKFLSALDAEITNVEYQLVLGEAGNSSILVNKVSYRVDDDNTVTVKNFDGVNQNQFEHLIVGLHKEDDESEHEDTESQDDDSSKGTEKRVPKKVRHEREKRELQKEATAEAKEVIKLAQQHGLFKNGGRPTAWKHVNAVFPGATTKHVKNILGEKLAVRSLDSKQYPIKPEHIVKVALSLADNELVKTTMTHRINRTDRWIDEVIKKELEAHFRAERRKEAARKQKKQQSDE